MSNPTSSNIDILCLPTVPDTVATDGYYESAIFQAGEYSSVDIITYSAYAFTLIIEKSGDGINFDKKSSHNIVANQGETLTIPVQTQFIRFILDFQVFLAVFDFRFYVYGSVQNNAILSRLEKMGGLSPEVSIGNNPLSSDGSIKVAGENIIHNHMFNLGTDGLGGPLEENSTFITPWTRSILVCCSGIYAANVSFSADAPNNKFKCLKMLLTSKEPAPYQVGHLTLYANPPLQSTFYRGISAKFCMSWFLTSSFVQNNEYQPSIITGIGDFNSGRIGQASNTRGLPNYIFGFGFPEFQVTPTVDYNTYWSELCIVTPNPYRTGAQPNLLYIKQSAWNVDKADGNYILPNLTGTWNQTFYNFQIRTPGGPAGPVLFDIQNPNTRQWVTVHVFENRTTSQNGTDNTNTLVYPWLYLMNYYYSPQATTTASLNINGTHTRIFNWSLSYDSFNEYGGGAPISGFGSWRLSFNHSVTMSSLNPNPTPPLNPYFLFIVRNPELDWYGVKNTKLVYVTRFQTVMQPSLTNALLGAKLAFWKGFRVDDAGINWVYVNQDRGPVQSNVTIAGTVASLVNNEQKIYETGFIRGSPNLWMEKEINFCGDSRGLFGSNTNIYLAPGESIAVVFQIGSSGAQSSMNLSTHSGMEFIVE